MNQLFKYILVLTIYLGTNPARLPAQCWTSTVPYNTSFDWMKKNMSYESYITNTQSAPNPFEMPYYAYSSWINNNNDNLTEMHIAESNGQLDINPADGWVLMAKSFGQPGSGNSRPHLILYNKMTGRIRVFYGLTGGIPGQYAYLQSQFSGQKGFTSSTKRTALFNFNAPIVKTLRYFDPDMDVNTINTHLLNNTGGDIYWYYSSFQTAYDPCACKIPIKNPTNTSILEFKQTIYNVSNITADINGSINQQVATSGGTGTGGTTVSSVIKSGLGNYETFDAYAAKAKSLYDNFNNSYKEKLYKEYWKEKIKSDPSSSSWSDARKELEYKDFIGSSDGKKQVAGISGLDKYGNVGNVIKGVASAVPYVGAAIGVIDALFGGDGGAAPAPPLNFDASLKLNGEIKNPQPTAASKLKNPGVSASMTGTTYAIDYNNTLGVLNMLEPPEFEYAEIKPIDMLRPTSSLNCCDVQAQDVNSGYAQNVVKNNYLYQYRIKKLPKIVLNPTLGLEIEAVDAAIVLDYSGTDVLTLYDSSGIGPLNSYMYKNYLDYRTTQTYQTRKKAPYFSGFFNTLRTNKEGIISGIESQKELELEFINKEYDDKTNPEKGTIRFRTPYVPLQCLGKVSYTLAGGGITPNTFVKVIIKLREIANPTKIYTNILTFDASNTMHIASKHTDQGTYKAKVSGTNCYSTCLPTFPLGPVVCLNSFCNDMNYIEFANINKAWANPFDKVYNGLPNPITLPNNVSASGSITPVPFSAPNAYYVNGNVHINANLTGITIYCTGTVTIDPSVFLTNCVVNCKVFNPDPNNPTNYKDAFTDINTTYGVSSADFIQCASPVSDIVANNTEIDNVCKSNEYETAAGLKRGLIDPKVDRDIELDPPFISLFPNPTSSITHISITNPISETAQISIYDMLGRELIQAQVSDIIAKNKQAIPLATDRLERGLYIVRVRHGEHTESFRLEVQK